MTPPDAAATIATEALGAIMVHSARRGFVVLRADIDRRNARSLGLVARLGFRATGAARRTLRAGPVWVEAMSFEARLAPPAGSPVADGLS